MLSVVFLMPRSGAFFPSFSLLHFQSKMYYDLCIPHNDADGVVHCHRLSTLIALGYSAAAATQSVTGQISAANRCTLEPLTRSSLAAAGSSMPALMRFHDSMSPLPMEAASLPSQSLAPICQLTRLTVSVSDPIQPQAWLEVIKTYDIVAVQPKSERAMHQACTSLECDVISLDMSQRLPFKLRPQILNTATSRGVHFEVLYSSALRDPTSRRHLFSNAQALARILRGRCLVLSSGARNAMELRGPHDVVNMAMLFGISQHRAVEAITGNCQAVITRAATRKLHASAIHVACSSAPLTTAAPITALEASRDKAEIGSGQMGSVNGSLGEAGKRKRS